MQVHEHVIASLALGAVLFAAGLPAPLCALLVLGGFLADVDHYAAFVHRKGSLDLRRAYRWFRLREWKREGIVFMRRDLALHNLEFVLVAAAATALLGQPWPWAAFAGFAFHLYLDLVQDNRRGNAFRLGYWSFLYARVRSEKV